MRDIKILPFYFLILSVLSQDFVLNVSASLKNSFVSYDRFAHTSSLGWGYFCADCADYYRSICQLMLEAAMQLYFILHFVGHGERDNHYSGRGVSDSSLCHAQTPLTAGAR